MKCDEVTIGCTAALLIVACFVMGFALNGWAEYCSAGLCDMEKGGDPNELKHGSVAMFTTSGVIASLSAFALLVSVLFSKGPMGIMGEMMYPYKKLY